MTLSNNTVAIPRMTRDLDQEFGKKGSKIGDTIFVRKPSRFIGRDGAAYQAEGLTDTQVPISITQQSGVDFQFSSPELKLSIDDWATRYGDPAGLAIANKLDVRALLMMTQNTGQFVGVPGTVPGLSGSDAFLTYAKAGQKLDEAGFPLKGQERYLFITPAMRVGWIKYQTAQFNSQNAISKQNMTGQVSDQLGYNWFVDQNCSTVTIGALGSTPAVAGANQTGSSINLSGLTASVTAYFNIGDSISFAGVYEVNPQSRVSVGSLQQFVVQAQMDSDAGGLGTVVISPALVPSGQFQNVSNSPANGALVNVYDTAAAGQGALAGIATPQGILMVKTAFAFVSFAGDIPDGTDRAFSETDSDTGIAMRFVRDFNSITDQWTNRYDVYYGSGPLYPEGSVRIGS